MNKFVWDASSGSNKFVRKRKIENNNNDSKPTRCWEALVTTRSMRVARF